MQLQRKNQNDNGFHFYYIEVSKIHKENFSVSNYWEKTQNFCYLRFLFSQGHEWWFYTNCSKISIVWRSIINEIQLEHKLKACNWLKHNNNNTVQLKLIP